MNACNAPPVGWRSNSDSCTAAVAAHMIVTPEPTVADVQMATVWWNAAPAGEREAMRRIVIASA